MPLTPAQAERVERYLPLVDGAVRRMAQRVPTGVDMADIRGAATIGLIEATQRIDPARAQAFVCYANRVINGRIRDQLRECDPLGRRVRQRVRLVRRARDELMQQLQRNPTDEEVRAATGLEPKLFRDAQWGESVAIESLDAPRYEDSDQNVATRVADENAPDGRKVVEGTEQLARVRELVRRLPDIERYTVTAYYYEGKRLQAIADACGKTESRMCQILKEALRRLHRWLTVGPDAVSSPS